MGNRSELSGEEDDGAGCPAQGVDASVHVRWPRQFLMCPLIRSTLPATVPMRSPVPPHASCPNQAPTSTRKPIPSNAAVAMCPVRRVRRRAPTTTGKMSTSSAGWIQAFTAWSVGHNGRSDSATGINRQCTAHSPDRPMPRRSQSIHRRSIRTAGRISRLSERVPINTHFGVYNGMLRSGRMQAARALHRFFTRRGDGDVRVRACLNDGAERMHRRP